MAQVQQSTRGGAVQVPASPADVFGSPHSVRQAFLQTAIDEHFLGQTVTGTGSSPQFITIPQAGLLRRIRLHISGTITLTGTYATTILTKDGLYKIIDRVYFRDVGNATRFDVSGYGLYQMSAVRTNSGHDPSFGTVTGEGTTTIFKSPALTSSAAFKFSFWLDLPFVYSKYDLRGLTNLNSPGRQSEMYIQLKNALGGDDTFPITLGSGVTATLTDINIVPEFWTYTVTKQQAKQGQQSAGPVIPMADLSVVHEIVEAKDNLIVNSDVYHLFAPGRSIQRATQYIVQNGSQTLGTIDPDTGSTAAGVDRVRLKYDNRNTPIDIRLSDHLRNTRDATERDFNFIYHDFSIRPWDSVLTPQLQLGVKLTSDASSAGTSFLDTVQENLYRTTAVEVQGVAG